MWRKFEQVGEIFCGPGGGGIGASLSSFSDGFCAVGIKHAWAIDKDGDSCASYRDNVARFQRQEFGIEEPPTVVHADVEDEQIDLGDPSQFPAVDGLIFGFPCNDFSLVGESKGLEGKFGPLYRHGITVLNRRDKPRWFVAENVSGLSSANEGKAFQRILSDMQRAGYCITVHKYRFEEYGVPQARARIVIVGFRDDLGLVFKVPAPRGQIKTAAEALFDIPEGATHHEKTRQSAQVVERLTHIKPGENAWNADLPPHLRLNVPKVRLSHIYRRLDPDKPSYTVTGSGGGGTHMYHWDEPRALTNRERARLQTFPDWFNFSGSKESVRKQIGMAIPPEGMKVICDAVLATLNRGAYDFVAPNIELADIL